MITDFDQRADKLDLSALNVSFGDLDFDVTGNTLEISVENSNFELQRERVNQSLNESQIIL